MKTLIRVLSVLLVLCAAALGALLYYRPAQPPATPLPQAAIRTVPNGAEGEFTPLDPPRPAPEQGFTARDGQPTRFADFRGRVVLVNLWATWCGPCIQEMPSLDRLQAKLGDRLTVLAISEDRSGAAVVEPFLQKLGLKHLAIYLDARNGLARDFAVTALPTSFLIDREGRVRWSLEGAARWDSPDMLARLEPYLRPAHDAPAMERTSLTR